MLQLYFKKQNIWVKDKSDIALGSSLPTVTGGWKTLSKDEWTWILGPDKSPKPGTNCRTSSTINGTANARYAEVKVNGVCGLLIFPDTFTWPEGITTSEPTTSTPKKTYAYLITFNANGKPSASSYDRNQSRSVRLVCAAQ